MQREVKIRNKKYSVVCNEKYTYDMGKNGT